ncbi:hypothetical protein O6H91_10G020900 [Diphasiastrum complanatum]|nr:hypothetical protein O6H91_10G020900 [Diphasiastrum complanatum]
MYPEGKVPTMFIDQDWIGDADVITDMLETKISIPTMRPPPEKATIGLKVFPLFVKFLRSKDSGDGSEQAFLAELQALNEHLKIEDAAHKNPFVSGRFPSMLDMNLTPKLYHMDVALKHFKNWSLPQDLVYLEAYMKKMFTRPSFTKTKSPEDVVIRGWQRHLSSIGQ